MSNKQPSSRAHSASSLSPSCKRVQTFHGHVEPQTLLHPIHAIKLCCAIEVNTKTCPSSLIRYVAYVGTKQLHLSLRKIHSTDERSSCLAQSGQLMLYWKKGSVTELTKIICIRRACKVDMQNKSS